MKPPLTNISVKKQPVPPGSAAVESMDEPGTVTVIGTGAGSGEGTAATEGNVEGAFLISGALNITGNVKVFGTVDSEFLKLLKQKFAQTDANGKLLWPPDAIMEDEVAIAGEFTDAFVALFKLQEGGIGPPTDGVPGRAKKLIEELVVATGWPAFNLTVPVPAPWNKEDRRDSFRRYEVSAAVDVLMRIYHLKGAGGSAEPTGLPPDR